MAEREEQCKVSEIDKAEKAFTKENEKLMEKARAGRGRHHWWLGAIEDEFARLGKERGTVKAMLMCDKPPGKLVEAIDGLEKIKAFKLQRVDREAENEVALDTSKISLDPRYCILWRRTTVIHSVS